MDLVVVVPVEALAALGTGDVVAPFTLAAMAGHGGRVLVACPAVPARKGQQLIPAAGNDVKILACKTKTTQAHLTQGLRFQRPHTYEKNRGTHIRKEESWGVGDGVVVVGRE